MAFVIFVLFPYKILLKDVRYTYLYVLIRSFLAPFVKVKFLDFIIVGCTCSLNKVILELINSACWFYNKDWEMIAVGDGCDFDPIWNFIILAFPFYILAMFYLRRFIKFGRPFPNLFGFVRFLSNVGTVYYGTVELLSHKNYFFLVGCVSYVLNVFGDMAVDWGLLRVWTKEKRFLRNKLKFRK